jgi:hypothetical protein
VVISGDFFPPFLAIFFPKENKEFMTEFLFQNGFRKNG